MEFIEGLYVILSNRELNEKYKEYIAELTKEFKDQERVIDILTKILDEITNGVIGKQSVNYIDDLL